MAVFFALLALIGWGVGDVFITIASRRAGNIPTLFWSQVISIILTSLYIPFAGSITDAWMFLFALVLGLSLSWGTLFYFRALEIGNAQLAGTIGGSFVLPVVLLSVIFFGESLSFLQIVGIILILAGLILASFDLGQLKNKKIREIFSDRGAKYAFLAMIVWGIYYAVIRLPVESIGWFWSSYPANLFFVFLLIFGKIKRSALKIFTDKKTLLAIVIFSVLINIAHFSYNLGILSGFTSVVAPIAGSYSVLFVILSRFVFKEPLTKQQKAGVVSSLLGIVLISFASS